MHLNADPILKFVARELSQQLYHCRYIIYDPEHKLQWALPRVGKRSVCAVPLRPSRKWGANNPQDNPTKKVKNPI
jgi:hypothetical protein